LWTKSICSTRPTEEPMLESPDPPRSSTSRTLSQRRPGNKGRRYPADPPRVEEIIAVMRHAGSGLHGRRLRGLIVVLWRAGLRISEALALVESDLEVSRGSVLVRPGKGGRRREVGTDDWAWEQLRPWLETRVLLPVGPLFCVVKGPTCGQPLASAQVRSALRRTAVQRRGAEALCSASASPRSCGRDGEGGHASQRHPAPARPRESRRHLDLPAGDRQRRDHRNRPQPAAGRDTRRRCASRLALFVQSASPTPRPQAIKPRAVDRLLPLLAFLLFGLAGGAVLLL